MCLFPFQIKNPSYKFHGTKLYVPVPCGKCPSCLKRRASGWQFRLKQHAKTTDNVLFITLTYDTTFVPISPKGFMTLCKKDFQLFMKRLRKLHPKDSKPIRYYAVGEYGTKRMRPHYHAIMFNALPHLVGKAWQDPETQSPIGAVDVQPVGDGAIAYVTKYLHKGKSVPMFAADDRLPEFSLMSKKMGINYINDNMIAWHQADITRNYVVDLDGIKVAMPRYYRERIFSDHQRKLQNHYYEKLTETNLARNERAFEERSGDRSVGAYERSDHEARKAELTNFRERARKNRKDIG